MVTLLLTDRTEKFPGSHVEIVESVESEAVNSFSFFRLKTLEELLIAGGVHGMAAAGDVRSAVWGGKYNEKKHDSTTVRHQTYLVRPAGDAETPRTVRSPPPPSPAQSTSV